MATQENDEDEISPFSSTQPTSNGFAPLQEGAPMHQLLQKHVLRSIQSTVVIRQLPSEGLSFQLWPAATSLVSLLDRHRSDPSDSPLSAAISAGPLRILELGSGTGIVGIVAAATLAANVTITDLPHVVPNIQFNADANDIVVGSNGGTVTVAPLRWGHADDVDTIGRQFDVIIASDVVYHDHLYGPLLETLRFFMLGKDGEGKEGKKMVFVMAHLKRWKKESAFFKKAKKHFDVDVLHTDSPCEGARVGIVIYRFVGKGSVSK